MLLIALVILFVCIYFYVSKSLDYWKSRGVPYVTLSLFDGLFNKTTLEEQAIDVYNKFSNKRYYGQFDLLRPVLVIRDPDLIKKIAVQWFDAFADHRAFAPSYVDPIWAKHLFSLKVDDSWHDLRTVLSPSFTSSKLKMMFELIQKCAEECTKHCQKQGGTVTIDAKDLFSRFTTDVIGTTSFGVTSNSYEDPQNEFYMMAKQTISVSTLKFLCYALIPRIMQLLDIRMFNKNLVRFFSGLISETLKLRRENKLLRCDMVHLLMEAQNGRLQHDDKLNDIDSGFSAVDESDAIINRKKKAKITDQDIVALGLAFFLGGFDTASNGMAFIAYELALNPDVQERLYKEITTTPRNENGKLSYEGLLGMRYLDMVVSETMRKWPAGWSVDRECTRSFTLEPENKDEKPLIINKGDQCIISIFPLHRDPNYFQDPDKFDPERFNDENKHNIKPFTYMPFGVGPRNCIGSRFALLETKLIIEEVVRNFEIIPIEKTPIPINLVQQGFGYYPSGGFWFGLKPRTNTV